MRVATRGTFWMSAEWLHGKSFGIIFHQLDQFLDHRKFLPPNLGCCYKGWLTFLPILKWPKINPRYLLATLKVSNKSESSAWNGSLSLRWNALRRAWWTAPKKNPPPHTNLRPLPPESATHAATVCRSAKSWHFPSSKTFVTDSTLKSEQARIENPSELKAKIRN